MFTGQDPAVSRELADHGARLQSAERWQERREQLKLEARMAKVESRVESMGESIKWNGQILTAILLGVFLQLLRDVTTYLRTRPSRKGANG
jgi:hypothetical protein